LDGISGVAKTRLMILTNLLIQILQYQMLAWSLSLVRQLYLWPKSLELNAVAVRFVRALEVSRCINEAVGLRHHDESMLPTFNMDDCLKYFKSVLTKINPNKIFQIPSWIPALDYPITAFDLEPPTYQQITNIIRKMKTSGSPSPLDQISIISFKRCPYLRSYLTELIQGGKRSRR
jgi:hypothetical protein